MLETETSTATMGSWIVRRLALAAVVAASLWAVGAASAAYLILRHGEPVGEVVMNLGAQLRNAAAPPEVRVESAEDREIDRKIAAGFEELRVIEQMKADFEAKKRASSNKSSKGKKR